MSSASPTLCLCLMRGQLSVTALPQAGKGTLMLMSPSALLSLHCQLFCSCLSVCLSPEQGLDCFMSTDPEPSVYLKTLIHSWRINIWTNGWILISTVVTQVRLEAYRTSRLEDKHYRTWEYLLGEEWGRKSVLAEGGCRNKMSYGTWGETALLTVLGVWIKVVRHRAEPCVKWKKAPSWCGCQPEATRPREWVISILLKNRKLTLLDAAQDLSVWPGEQKKCSPGPVSRGGGGWCSQDKGSVSMRVPFPGCGRAEQVPTFKLLC